MIDACHARDVAALPGCFSPTEILDAWESGADIVKVFPATALGPGFFKDVRGPLPQVKLMPTGGVTLDNAGDWIRAGAVAVGVGTALLDGAAIAAGAYDVLRANAERIVANVRAARGHDDASVARRAKVVTFGEIMLRLSPPGFERFLQSPVLSATFGGGEANVAVSLAHFGSRASTSRRFRRTPSVRRPSALARRRRTHRSHRPRAATARGDLLRGNGSQPARLDRHLRSGALVDQRDRAGRRGLERGHDRRGLVSRDRHHAGARRERGRGHRARHRAPRGRPARASAST